MSCLVMNPEPLAALANAVETRLNIGYDYWGFEAPDSLFRELADCRTTSIYHAEPIYRRLYTLNARAHNGRYSGHEEPENKDAPEVDVGRYSVTHRPEYQSRSEGNGTTFAVLPWHYQLAQLLDFWLYQTNEDATRNDPLRLSMLEFRDSLYQFIVRHSPPYFNAKWGELPQYIETNRKEGRGEEGKGRVDITAEFEFLTNYIIESCFDEEICRDRLRMLWTAFCLHHDLDADTHIYDYYLSELWRRLQETGDGTSEWADFDSFELFMCRYLV